MPNLCLDRSTVLSNITDVERERYERVCVKIFERKENPDDILALEERLKEILVEEKNIRALRQEYENRLRSYKLSEAIITSKKL